MRITQGTFSFLPELTDEQIGKQIDYAHGRGFTCAIEFTKDPHPRNVYWEMWGMPRFDDRDTASLLREVNACRKANPDAYVKVNAFDPTSGWETVRLSFIVQRPANEPEFELERQEVAGRSIRYTIHGASARGKK